MHKPSVALLLLVMLLTACADVPTSTATPGSIAGPLQTATATPRSITGALQTDAASTPTPVVATRDAVLTAAATPTALAATASAAKILPTPPPVPAPVVTTKDAVNLRAMPSTVAAVVTLLAPSTDADVIETNVAGTEAGPPWMRVSYNGQTGYVRSDLVSAPHAKATSTVTSATSTAIPATTPATTPVTVVPLQSLPPTATISSAVTPVSIVASVIPAMVVPTATARLAPTAMATRDPVPATATTPAMMASASTLAVSFTSISSPIPHGATATAKVTTAPGAACSIEVDYKSGESKAAGLVDKTADSAGAVSWTWMVGTRTTPGSWPVTVTCAGGGKSAVGKTNIQVT